MKNILSSNNIFYKNQNIPLENSNLTANDLDNVMGKYFNNVQANNISLDENGFTRFSIKNGQKIINLNNSVSFKGKSVR